MDSLDNISEVKSKFQKFIEEDNEDEILKIINNREFKKWYKLYINAFITENLNSFCLLLFITDFNDKGMVRVIRKFFENINKEVLINLINAKKININCYIEDLDLVKYIAEFILDNYNDIEKTSSKLLILHILIFSIKVGSYNFFEEFFIKCNLTTRDVSETLENYIDLIIESDVFLKILVKLDIFDDDDLYEKCINRLFELDEDESKIKKFIEEYNIYDLNPKIPITIVMNYISNDLEGNFYYEFYDRRFNNLKLLFNYNNDIDELIQVYDDSIEEDEELGEILKKEDIYLVICELIKDYDYELLLDKNESITNISRFIDSRNIIKQLRIDEITEITIKPTIYELYIAVLHNRFETVKLFLDYNNGEILNTLPHDKYFYEEEPKVILEYFKLITIKESIIHKDCKIFTYLFNTGNFEFNDSYYYLILDCDNLKIFKTFIPMNVEYIISITYSILSKAKDIIKYLLTDDKYKDYVITKEEIKNINGLLKRDRDLAKVIISTEKGFKAVESMTSFERKFRFIDDIFKLKKGEKDIKRLVINKNLRPGYSNQISKFF